MMTYTIGIDYGSNTARAIIVDTESGVEIGEGISPYTSGANGILLDPFNANVARHNPSDYIDATREVIQSALKQAEKCSNFSSDKIVGIGIDATASTTLPIDADGVPLAFNEIFKNDINSMAWLWKDHSSVDEAEEITSVLEERWPEYLKSIGGAYSSEWFWSKLLRFSRIAPEAYKATATWIEVADWLTNWLCGNTDPNFYTRSVCIAGHKGLYGSLWDGYPGKAVITAIDPVLLKIKKTLSGKVLSINEPAGRLGCEAADFLHLPKGIAVSVSGIDAHIGALGSGIKPGRMVKILGTSGVDLVVTKIKNSVPTISGVSGVVPHSIIPGYITVEGGQCAIGDIYGWYVEQLSPKAEDHKTLTYKASGLVPGESGLLGLDWYNGNRTILMDQRLSGLLLGMNLQTRPEHIYRALIESTAFGSKVIIDLLEESGISVNEIVVSGGLPDKNSLVMQIFADVLERPLMIPTSTQTAALGSAISATIASAKLEGRDVPVLKIIEKMTSFRTEMYKPNPQNFVVYRELYSLYKELHDVFGREGYTGNLAHVMKRLISLRENALKTKIG